MLSEITQTEKDKDHMISIIMWKSKNQKQTPKQNRNKLIDIENKVMVA